MIRTILVTGGAGFIGTQVVRRLVNNYPDYKIFNLDKLTYAGNLANLQDVKNKENYHFLKGDICDADMVTKMFSKYDFDVVVHLAAESHVDRSIKDPGQFVETNVIGTVNMLNAARAAWENASGKLFYHISTDEVYGSLGKEGYFTETTSYDPKSPYSASKASSDHFVRAYQNTYGLPVIISNCSNNYGPYQFPEKLIPLSINNIREGKPIPVYGKGENVRDWLYVVDHAAAIDRIIHDGLVGETYNIGGFNEWKNIDLIRLLCDIMDEEMELSPGTSSNLITFVKDRAGHDMRYAIDASKIKTSLGWTPSVTFEEGLRETVKWYLSNLGWLSEVTTGQYQSYYQQYYLTK